MCTLSPHHAEFGLPSTDSFDELIPDLHIVKEELPTGSGESPKYTFKRKLLTPRTAEKLNAIPVNRDASSSKFEVASNSIYENSYDDFFNDTGFATLRQQAEKASRTLGAGSLGRAQPISPLRKNNFFDLRNPTSNNFEDNYEKQLRRDTRRQAFQRGFYQRHYDEFNDAEDLENSRAEFYGVGNGVRTNNDSDPAASWWAAVNSTGNGNDVSNNDQGDIQSEDLNSEENSDVEDSSSSSARSAAQQKLDNFLEPSESTSSHERKLMQAIKMEDFLAHQQIAVNNAKEETAKALELLKERRRERERMNAFKAFEDIELEVGSADESFSNSSNIIKRKQAREEMSTTAGSTASSLNSSSNGSSKNSSSKNVSRQSSKAASASEEEGRKVKRQRSKGLFGCLSSSALSPNNENDYTNTVSVSSRKASKERPNLPKVRDEELESTVDRLRRLRANLSPKNTNESSNSKSRNSTNFTNANRFGDAGVEDRRTIFRDFYKSDSPSRRREIRNTNALSRPRIGDYDSLLNSVNSVASPQKKKGGNKAVASSFAYSKLPKLGGK